MYRDQWTLGRLVSELATRPRDQNVYFDFARMVPGVVMSYRGFYDHLAISYVDDGEPRTVDSLLTELRQALGCRFEGYKGGGFTMTLSTPIWVSNYGRCSDTAVVGIEGRDETIIETGWQEV